MTIRTGLGVEPTCRSSGMLPMNFTGSSLPTPFTASSRSSTRAGRSGAVCVLACQSIASVHHALAHGSGSWDQNGAAVDILCTNTATKIAFRSTDPEVASRVSELSPHRPGLPGVVRVRPVSTLAPGECYASLADGRFERRQLGRFRVESANEADASPDAGDDETEASPDADAVEPEPVPTAGVVELEASPAVGVPEPEAAPVVLVGAFEPAGGAS